MRAVPEIDVAPLVRAGAGDAAVAEVARAVDAACADVGFFTVVGHGVDAARRARLDEHARAFFALPEREKAEIAMAHGGRAWRGWFPLGGELTSGVPDHKEGIYFGAEHVPDHHGVRAGRPLHGPNQFPVRPAGLRDAVLAYLDAMTRLGQVVLGGIALGLGLERSWFVEHLTADPTVLLRVFRYPPVASGARGWGVAEHTDYGLLTLLGQDGTGGLEVRTRAGWVPVVVAPDAFVCNLGDMLERLTGGRYRSTPHRVRNTSGRERLTYPFFLDPSWDAEVGRLPIVDRPPAGGKAADRWDRASVHGFTGTYGEYLTAKVARVFPELFAASAAEPPPDG